jgi:hypothetical protein
MTPEERDRIERQALEFFSDLYASQGDRTLAAVGDGSASDAELLARINELYATEAQRGASAYAGFWRAIMIAVAFQSLTGEGVGADNPALNDDGSGISPQLNDALERYLAEMARLFGNRYSENSLRLTFEAIEQWRTNGGTVGDLRDIMNPIWEGSRPITASIHETTRIVNLGQNTAWGEAGFWGYNVRTRNDSQVRPEHQAIADAGPYPMSDREHVPPFDGLFGDLGLIIGCRCITSPVVEPPNG